MKIAKENISVVVEKQDGRAVEYFQLLVEIETGEEQNWQGCGRRRCDSDPSYEPGRPPNVPSAALLQSMRLTTRAAFLYHVGEKVFAEWNLPKGT